jgi:hypothetical protein
MIEQRFKLGQRVFVMQNGLFGPRWFRIEDIFKLKEGRIAGAHSYYTNGHGNPIVLYSVVDEDGNEMPNHDEMLGRGEYKDRDICASVSDAVAFLVQMVDKKIEELNEVKRELLNNIEEERREQPYINEDLFDLSA